MDSSPTSVAMCTHNGAAYVRAQLESIARQTHLPKELVVCDDRSSDDTPDLVQRFVRDAPFPVRLYANQNQLGLSKNFERAIALCRGELIALSDQDDVWFPDKLARTVEVLRAAPDAGLVFADAEVVDSELRPLNYRVLENLGFGRHEKRAMRRGQAFDLLLRRNFVMGATVVFRSRFRDLVLPIPGGYGGNHDGWIGLLVSGVGDIEFLDDAVMFYRQHATQFVGAQQSTRTRRRHSAVRGLRPEVPLNGSVLISEELREMSDILRTRARQHPGARRAANHLEARISHHDARKSMPSARLARLPVLLRELVSLRYHRYSHGNLSAVRDLVKKPDNIGSGRGLA